MHLWSHVRRDTETIGVESGPSGILRGSDRSAIWIARVAEANDFNIIGLVLYHNVVKFQLSMREALLIDMAKACQHLAEEVFGCRLTERLLAKVLRKLVALH